MYSRNNNQKIYNDKIVKLLTKLIDLLNQSKYETVNIGYPVLERISFNESNISSITSNQIEGIIITDNLKNDLKNLNQTLIDNYKNILVFIKNNYANLSLDLKEILLEHQLLFSNTHLISGKLKSSNNYVINSKTREIIDYTTKSNEVESYLNELIYWYNNNNELDPIIKILVFIYDFLKIHPFDDGNGRISRLLTNLLLLKQNFLSLKYISFEQYISLNVDKYYESLRSQNPKSWFDNEVDYTNWIEYMLDILVQIQTKYIQLNEIYKVINKYKKKPDQIKAYLTLNLNHEYSLIELQNIFYNDFNISFETTRKTLQSLVKQKFINKINNTKNAKYICVKKDV